MFVTEKLLQIKAWNLKDLLWIWASIKFSQTHIILKSRDSFCWCFVDGPSISCLVLDSLLLTTTTKPLRKSRELPFGYKIQNSTSSKKSEIFLNTLFNNFLLANRLAFSIISTDLSNVSKILNWFLNMIKKFGREQHISNDYNCLGKRLKYLNSFKTVFNGLA